MTIRLALILAAIGCALVAVIIGFGWDVLGFGSRDDIADWGGWLALSLVFYLTSHITPRS